MNIDTAGLHVLDFQFSYDADNWLRFVTFIYYASVISYDSYAVITG